MSKNHGYKVVMVDFRPEEVDLYIVNHAKRGDIVVTQDHGLASLLLPKGIKVISPRDRLMNYRHLGKLQRKAGMGQKVLVNLQMKIF
ncbi:DUF188 domain-containing protein [Anaerobacillus alkaliphilus]|uniref:DUF188 domain-containing protein n=1 Tax=Anaerobacillus alkaliphilus TaxID=1548597 RepID=UPI001F4FC5FD|nr:DUF188 domain-containing protein [Anaerobacillus alkaliphilus]